MSFFSCARNVTIKGSPTFNIVQNLHPQTVDEGLKILYANAAPGALHNSGERFDPPRCHPSTRVALQQHIMTWLDDSNSEFSAMWMNGSMGAGKSAIAQTIAELCYEQGQLLASFFFARGSADRNNEKKLVASLAYQMSLQIPETRPHLSAAILDDPLIFQSLLQSQIDRLIIGPLSRVPATDARPRLIIIDGLDECEIGDARAQALIVNAFVSSIVTLRQAVSIPYKILIVSRPETNIEAAFRALAVILPLTRYLMLNDSWKPDADIRHFLVDSFAEIRHTHPLRKYLTAEWPSLADIDELLRKSSSHFIYASIVMKFLRSPRNHPIQSLKIILGLVKDIKTRPYEELDALYAHIFSKVDDINLVLGILCIPLSLPKNRVTIGDIEIILHLPKGMLNIAFNDLVSVIRAGDPSGSDDVFENNPFGKIQVPLMIRMMALTSKSRKAEIKFLHSSLTEYLKDKDRSGDYYAMSAEICVDVAHHCIKSLIEAEKIEKCDYKLLCMILLPDLVDRSSVEAQMSLCSAISNVNLTTILQQRFQSITDCRPAVDSHATIGVLQDSYSHAINWIYAKVCPISP